MFDENEHTHPQNNDEDVYKRQVTPSTSSTTSPGWAGFLST